MGSKNQTVTQSADPWAEAQPYLKGALGGAESLYNQGAFAPDPYSGQRVAGFGDASVMSQDMIMQQAQQPQLSGQAGSYLGNMMDPNYQSQQLEQVKQNALGSAIPSAVSMFSGSGMTNSSQAMDTVGRAATEAVAPYEYNAFNMAQDRGMQAAGMAPSIDRAGYLPATMIGAVGASQDAMRQSEIGADMQRYYETEGQDAQNFQGYLNSIMGLGGMGGTATETEPGASALQSIASGGLTGVGTYGALMGNPATAPFALPIGVGAGLLGMI